MDTPTRPLSSWLIALQGFTGSNTSPVYEIPKRTRQRGTVFFQFDLERGSAVLHLEGTSFLRRDGKTLWEPLTPPLSTAGPFWAELPVYVRAVVTNAEQVTMRLRTSLHRIYLVPSHAHT